MKLSFITLGAGQGADIYSTGICVGRGSHEANPALRPLEGHPVAFGAAKIGVASSIGLAAWRLRESHPRLALLINLSGGALGFALGARNARVCS